MFTGRIASNRGGTAQYGLHRLPRPGPSDGTDWIQLPASDTRFPRLSGKMASRMGWPVPIALRCRCRRVDHRARFVESGPGKHVPMPSRQLSPLDLVGGHVRDRRPLAPCGPRQPPGPQCRAAIRSVAVIAAWHWRHKCWKWRCRRQSERRRCRTSPVRGWCRLGSTVESDCPAIGGR